MSSPAADDTAPIVDESVALWAARLTAPTRNTDADVVARLRHDVIADLPAVDAAAREWTQLGGDLPPTRVRVVGRVGWVRANLAALRGAFDPLAERLTSRRAGAARVLGAQLGSLLGLLSSKVLGQFILPFGGPGGGQLVVVGPNLLDLGAKHGDLATGIRRAVLVHEVTHRLQFDGTDWLGEHLRGLLDRYLAGARLEPGALLDAAGRLPRAVVDARETASIQPVIEALLTPDQAEIISEAQGLMSLLEGHGNAAMFGAGDALLGDTEAIRTALLRRHDDVTTRVLTTVAGLELKRRQYREGEAFVHAVVDRAGIDGLNRAFAAPANLPSQREVGEPDAWLARVEGR